MKEGLTQYLHKFLNLYFLNYPEDLVNDCYKYFSHFKDTYTTDIKSKYPKVEADDLSDDKLLNIIQFDTCIEAIFYYRLERSIFIEIPNHPLLPYLANLMKIKTGMELYYSTDIGPGLNIQHGTGIVIGPRFNIGSNFMIHQGVTIGQKYLNSPHETIIIGNNVTVFAGAKILGNIKIGNNVQIGANAVLISDAESNAVYAGIPAKKIRNIKIS
jgi:serine O-acetyltransferase